ncbi:MAG TPA: tetratricopeptide repeat protein [Candidatus Polarisedimenticolia bacterium]|nr:tetratricopeptide repeat protein [Candidatus Polarisedimenticolia bacterium]
MLRFPRAPREASAFWVAAGVFALALGLRLLTLLQLHDSGLWDYLRLDPLYYHDWARAIAAGTAPADGTYEMTPLYAYWLAAMFRLFGDGLLIPRLAQVAVGSAACAVASLIGCRLFGRAEGALAGVALALYGPSLFHETQIMKTVFTVALTTAAAAALYWSEGRRPWRLALGGALVGLTALCQENINVILPFTCAWIAWRAPRGRKLAGCAALTAAWAAAVAPATLRNLAVAGEAVLITSGGGEVFYTGNNEFASGKYRPPAFMRPDPFYEHEDFRAEAARRLGRPVTRAESDAFWWREGMRFIRENPGRWMALLGDKLLTFFTGYERPDNYSYENFSRFVPILSAPLPGFALVAPFGLAGIVLARRRWAEAAPLLFAMGAYLLSALLFFTQSRYRMPMVPLLAPFGAHAAVAAWRAARRRHAVRAAAIAVPVALLAVAMSRDPGHGSGFAAQNHGILGEMHLHAGRPGPALTHFREAVAALRDYPGDSSGDQHRRVEASSHFGIVLALEMADDPGSLSERMEHLRAAALSPDADLRRDALDRLGALLMEQGDPAAAAAAYEAAVRLDPKDFGRRLRLAEALHRGGRPQEALTVVEAAVREAPGAGRRELAAAHYGRALIFLGELRDPARAAAHLEEVLRLDPTHPRAGWIRERLASLEGAR